MTVSTKNIRNVIFISHSGAGKTTMVENLLFAGGTIPKKGTISEGTTVSDYNEDEKERKNSISLSVASYEKDGVKVNLLDAPGYLDYIGEVVAGIKAADAAVLVIDAVDGVKVGATKIIRQDLSTRFCRQGCRSLFSLPRVVKSIDKPIMFRKRILLTKGFDKSWSPKNQSRPSTLNTYCSSSYVDLDGGF